MEPMSHVGLGHDNLRLPVAKASEHVPEAGHIMAIASNSAAAAATTPSAAAEPIAFVWPITLMWPEEEEEFVSGEEGMIDVSGNEVGEGYMGSCEMGISSESTMDRVEVPVEKAHTTDALRVFT